MAREVQQASCPFKDGTDRLSRNIGTMLRNIPEEGRSHLHHTSIFSDEPAT
jgi:hypothetical protein